MVISTSNKQVYLNALGIQVWQLSAKKPLKNTCELNPSALWDTLQTTVKNCTACTLHSGRTQTVFGVGNQQAELMLIGEAPGFHEDQQGEPFVGRAGQLLNAMLQAMGLTRDQVY